MKTCFILLLALRCLAITAQQTIQLDTAVVSTYDRINDDYHRFYVVAFEYNPQHQVNSRTDYSINSAGDSVYQDRYLYTYNDAGQITVFEDQEWDWTLNKWTAYEIDKYSYNAEGLKDTIYTTTYNADTIVRLRRTIFQYNQYDLLSFEYQEDLDLPTGQWTGHQKWEYTYTPFKQLASEIENNYSSATNQYEPYLKTVYAYGQGNLLSTTNSYWVNGNWQYYTVKKNRYNANGQIIRTIGQRWNTDLIHWIDDFRDTLIYDVEKQLINQTRYTWYMDFQLWVPDDSVHYEYDAFNDVVEETRFYSNGDNWMPSSKDTYEYNTKLDLNSIVWPFEPGAVGTLPFKKQLVRLYEYGDEGGWVVQDKIDFYYGWITAFKAVEYAPDAIYPNPAANDVHLELSDVDDQTTLDLYSANGQLVVHWKISEIANLSVGQFPPGLYYYLIHNGSKNLVGKLVIAH